MRERLAQQLLVFVLNLHLRVRNIGATIDRPGGGLLGSDELISSVIAAWESDDADAQAELEQLLATLNDGAPVRFIHDHPCRLP